MTQLLPDKIVIMFADVSGSTQLYERLGDSEAHDCISASLDRIVQHARRYDGHLVETIGDEAMLMFADCDDAAQAAIAMQQHFFRDPVANDQFVKIRIGFHFGPIEYDSTGHPFGDTVNVAARVAALCEAGRVIATDSTVRCLTDGDVFQLRPYQTTRVKGKSKPIRVQEVVWDREDSTSMVNATQFTQLTQLENLPFELQLYYQGQIIEMIPGQGPFLIGRDASCNLVIDSALASRAHARLEFRWGEFVLTDHSTNGTYVEAMRGKREGDGASVRLHRREMVLSGMGKIAIGTKVEQATEVNLLGYKIEQH
ncbi:MULTISPECIES: adenylate/guanylate cyclase domain-containing protein [unclassified Ketobacter]|uniref:adenylate/guanylate cyclase domain-containing protein n=1 Tax=unclassified Ketobacter TaxID=2639109 RepID=UPI0025BB0243|nr:MULTISPECIES: adenylate/guanylate cyclase domain-containing protein [unclassified Ketobacter]MCK5790895.1 adenylate/guanylate cyclase domain-containing protein [Ketobacter sp.]MEC8810034.1 adenylate/guanylate cyclase domain-containing protein [Pseudomonadota bacterium]